MENQYLAALQLSSMPRSHLCKLCELSDIGSGFTSTKVTPTHACIRVQARDPSLTITSFSRPSFHEIILGSMPTERGPRSKNGAARGPSAFCDIGRGSHRVSRTRSGPNMTWTACCTHDFSILLRFSLLFRRSTRFLCIFSSIFAKRSRSSFAVRFVRIASMRRCYPVSHGSTSVPSATNLSFCLFLVLHLLLLCLYCGKCDPLCSSLLERGLI